MAQALAARKSKVGDSGESSFYMSLLLSKLMCLTIAQMTRVIRTIGRLIVRTYKVIADKLHSPVANAYAVETFNIPYACLCAVLLRQVMPPYRWSRTI